MTRRVNDASRGTEDDVGRDRIRNTGRPSLEDWGFGNTTSGLSQTLWGCEVVQKVKLQTELAFGGLWSWLVSNRSDRQIGAGEAIRSEDADRMHRSAVQCSLQLRLQMRGSMLKENRMNNSGGWDVGRGMALCIVCYGESSGRRQLQHWELTSCWLVVPA